MSVKFHSFLLLKAPFHRLITVFSSPGRLSLRVTLLLASLFVCFDFNSSWANNVDLEEASLEQLSSMGLSTLPKSVSASTAARLQQTTATSPSVVRIITAEDIRIFGYRTMEDILRSFPGLYTTSDGMDTFLGVRGLGRAGDYNNRILILIDGVRVNDNVFDSSMVGRHFPLDVGLIERVEYAPGPGSAVYGKNAFFGVINVITKDGSSFDGAEILGGVGNADTRKVRASYGERLENDADVLLSVTGYEDANLFPPWGGVSSEYDDNFTQNVTAFAKYSKGGFQAEFVSGRRNKGTSVYPWTGLEDAYSEYEDKRLFINLHYSKKLSSDWQFEIDANYNEGSYTGYFPYLDDDGNYFMETEDYPGKWLGTELHFINTSITNHRILFGFEGQKDIEQKVSWGLVDEEPYYYLEDDTHSYGFFIQDEISLTDTITFLAGARYDHSETTDQLNPRAGIIWQPTKDDTVKLLYGSAFRAANFFESGSNLAVPYAEVLEPETITTWELATEHYFDPTLRVSGSLYHYRIEDIIEEEFLEEYYQVIFNNGNKIEAVGAEFEAEKRFAGGVRVDLNYALQQTEDDDGERLSNSPTHQLKLRSSIPLWFANGTLAAEMQYISHRLTEEGVELDPYLLANVTATWQPNDTLSFSASIYNIGDTSYSDPVRATLGEPNGIEQEGRLVYVQLGIRF